MVFKDFVPRKGSTLAKLRSLVVLSHNLPKDRDETALLVRFSVQQLLHDMPWIMPPGPCNDF